MALRFCSTDRQGDCVGRRCRLLRHLSVSLAIFIALLSALSPAILPSICQPLHSRFAAPATDRFCRLAEHSILRSSAVGADE